MRREERMPERSRRKHSQGKTIAVIAVLLFLALSLIGLLGGLGNVIKRFLTGTFGFASYVFVAFLILIAIVKGFGLSRKKGSARLISYASVLAVLLLLYAQIITSYKFFEALSSASYKGYLSACYDAGLKTCGGVVVGVIAFPFLSLMGKYSAIAVSALFFIVLFFAILPFLRATASDEPRDSRAPQKKGGKVKASKDSAPLKLFVDKVRAGEKDAAVLKQRGLFDKKIADFEVYNVNDDRPFASFAGGTIPESNPDRYNPYADSNSFDRGRSSRASDRDYDYDDFDDDGELYSANSNDRIAKPIARDPSFRDDRGELPLFMRRFKDDKAEAPETASSAEDRFKSVMPDEPVYNNKESEPSPEKKVEPPKKKDAFYSPLVSDYKKRAPLRDTSDIISDVSDLDRLNGHSSSNDKRETSLAEEPIEREAPAPIEAKPEPAPVRDRYRFVFPKEPTYEYKQDAFTFEKEEPKAPPASVWEKPVYKAPEPAEPKPIEPAPIFERKEEKPAPIEESVCKPDEIAAEEPEPIIEEKPVEPPVSYQKPTITASDASTMKPVEQEYPARTFSEPKAEKKEPIAPVRPTFAPPAPPVENEEENVRKRKPRSDIGGTHYTESKKQESAAPAPQSSSFIPPKKAEQVTIETVEEELPPRPYTAPPVSLLTDYPSQTDEEGVEEMGERLTQALASFNISSEIVDHKTGPTFTQYAVTLPASMSVSKITPLDKDIKRKLMLDQKKDIRIISSVAGFDAVGIEVPNKTPSMVGLRSMINSPKFSEENKLMFAIGVDVSGKPVYGDLLKMPHLLVAGSTGSGKSVCLNVLICSMMYHYSPETVRFIMIDPKRVELAVYKDMPHMVMPSTVTDVNKAINALNWAVTEMYRRYDLFQEANCRNIFQYNDKQKKSGGKKMYYIVIIIDEMAELMSRAKKDVEDKIQSLMALARAAGIHLVIATQRPSVDVITGTIKNNIPTRIAFKVTSINDSRTILDRGGAEALFGHGDMLYVPPEGGEPTRLQGPYLDLEVSEIVDFIKKHNDCRFDSNAEKIIQAEKAADQDASALNLSADPGNDDDPLFADALLSVIDIGQASISKLQRVFRIGYSRAARIVDQMEEKGYIGPTDASNKPRAVLITREEYFQLYGEDGIEGGEAQ